MALTALGRDMEALAGPLEDRIEGLAARAGVTVDEVYRPFRRERE
jgi:hypothetical protein